MKKKISSMQLGAVYFFVHFTIEVASFYLLYSRIAPTPMWTVLALLYDALAFVPQCFFGVIADRYKKVNFGLIGCVIVLISLVIQHNMISLVFVGFGNAFAHIGGAQKTLTTSENKITPTSLYVGGGSFGVIIGQLLGALQNKLLISLPIMLLLGSIIILIVISKKSALEEKKWNLRITKNHSVLVILVLAFLVVVIRAYIGYAVPTEWNKTKAQAILLFFTMGLGKILGGLFCDTIGYYKTALISSVLSLPFLLFGNSIMILSLIGIGLFSMTMPITIAMLVSLFPKQPCFAFGITTVALFVGTLPVFFIRPSSLFEHQITVLILIVIATLVMLICLEKENKYEVFN